jgi:perosamine synthetase
MFWVPASLPFLGLGETRYRAPHPVGGISSLAAGVLVRTVGLVPAEVRRRRANAERLRKLVDGGTVPRVPEGWEAGWLRFPVVLQRTAEGVQTPYNEALGVLRGYPKSLAELEGFGARRLNPFEVFGGARRLAERLVTLPTHRFVRSARVAVF